MTDLSLLKCRLDGRYDVHTRLGRGSYAEIYVAEDILASPHSPHKQVVIKALNVFMQNDLDHDLERTLVENFQNEAIALDRVRHPNIISRLGHGTARDLKGIVFHYLALEYLSGGDLAKLCRNKGLTLGEALFYIEQVCAGLGHAHQNGIIHRDIKPQNLLLSGDRKTVKIADFGVARFTQSDSPITRVGTNIYAPPEHSPMLAGQTGLLKFPKLTPAADIYSLAKSVYVLITSESPRYFANHPINELPFALRRNPWAEELVRILEKATQNDSVRRHQTVQEFWQELARLKKYTETLATAGPPLPAEADAPPAPQPHVAAGYSPHTPQKPQFETTSKLNPRYAEENVPAAVIDLENPPAVPPEKKQPVAADQLPVSETQGKRPQLENRIKILPSEPPGRRGTFGRIGLFAGLLFIFAGALFATQYYLRHGDLLPGLGSPFQKTIGVATTNINLRSEPRVVNGRDSNIIGMVTIDSRVEILDTRNNWYRVEVIEYGRPKKNPDFADRGWVYGKFVNVGDR